MKEDGNVDLHANKIITKKKGIKRRAVCQPVGGSPHKRPSSPPSPSIPEPSFPVPLATREFRKIITKRKVITKRRVELLPVGGSPKKPEIGFQERQTVPPAEGVQTPSMTRRGPQPSPPLL
ncbi:hypothetical protein TNCT_208011 [Trichonephila clavata]|uniref:Uncharacterized protein n=1 Tax=Trichonephila clavata TaxID=2740835 RepID=A0A8X6JXD7_TRICU|nr:hypothetical protein TNCT_208011 [Trichonephila clavata]